MENDADFIKIIIIADTANGHIHVVNFRPSVFIVKRACIARPVDPVVTVGEGLCLGLWGGQQYQGRAGEK